MENHRNTVGIFAVPIRDNDCNASVTAGSFIN